MWPWGGWQDIRVRKENEVGDSFLTLSLCGTLRLAVAQEDSSLYFSRHTLRDVLPAGPRHGNSHTAVGPYGPLHPRCKATQFVLRMSAFSFSEPH